MITIRCSPNGYLFNIFSIKEQLRFLIGLFVIRISICEVITSSKYYLIFKMYLIDGRYLNFCFDKVLLCNYACNVRMLFILNLSDETANNLTEI